MVRSEPCKIQQDDDRETIMDEMTPLLKAVDILEKWLCFEKARSTKYIQRIPDGKGGWKYIYKDSSKKENKIKNKESIYDKYAKEKIDYPKDLIGKKVVGYRYGKAPEDERSYNHRENKKENGVSMAKIGHAEESQLFATQNLKEKGVKKYYYEGIISGTGGDDEILLKDIKEISRNDFLSKSNNDEIIDIVNKIIVGQAEDIIGLINRGWNVGSTKEKVKQRAIEQVK